MKPHRNRVGHRASERKFGLCGSFLALFVLAACTRAMATPAPVSTVTAAPTLTLAIDTPTPGPSATPWFPVQPVGLGLVRYVNRAAGFSFNYPATWSLIETPATGAQPASVWLRWELFRLLIEYKPTAGGPPLQAYGSARNWREAGFVVAMGQDVAREVLRVEGKVKRATYRVDRRPISAGDLVLGITLRSAAVDECMGVFDLDCDYASVDLPQPVQDEADRIVASLELVPVSEASVEPHDDWSRYVRADYGFALSYPPGWVVSEGRDFVAFTQDTVRLVVGYGSQAAEINVCCTFGPDLAVTQEAGSIAFLGQYLSKAVLADGESVRAVVYNGAEPVAMSGRAFLAYMQDYTADTARAAIPPRLQGEADQILASLTLLEAAFPLPGPAPIPTEEPVAPTPEVVAPADALVRGRDTGGERAKRARTSLRDHGFSGHGRSSSRNRPVSGLVADRFRQSVRLDFRSGCRGRAR